MKKILLTFLFALTALAVSVSSAHAANVTVSPSSGDYNSNFTIEIRADLEEAVTAAKVYLNFNSAVISGLSIDKSDSAFQTTWPEAAFDNNAGVLKLQAGQNTPGVNGEILVAKATFSPKSTGTVTFSLDPSSVILTSSDRNLISSYPTNLAAFNITVPSTPVGGGGGGGGGGGSGGGGGGGGGSSSGGISGGGTCTKRGDVDCNGRVDLIDLSRLLSNWRRGFRGADFNNNGIVDIVDLSVLLSNWRR